MWAIEAPFPENRATNGNVGEIQRWEIPKSIIPWAVEVLVFRLHHPFQYPSYHILHLFLSLPRHHPARIRYQYHIQTPLYKFH